MAVATCNSCCCCIELRLGCLIYGYLELLSTIYAMINFIILPKTLRALVEEEKMHGDTEEIRAFVQLMESVIRVANVAMIIAVVAMCIKLMFVVTFVIGLHKNKRGLVGIYLIFSAIFLIISLIVTIVVFAKIANQDKVKVPEALWVNQIVTFIFVYIFSIYFWMVIRSQYHKMDVNKQEEPTVSYRA